MSKYISIDTEFGGTHPGASLLTIGMIVYDENLRPLDTLYVRVKHDTYSVSPEALELAKINLAEHHYLADDIKEARHKVRTFMFRHGISGNSNYLVPIGAGIAGDVEILKANGFHTGLLSHNVIDVTVVARFLQSVGLLNCPSISLEALAKHFGMTHTPHNALSDASVAAEVFRMFQKLVKGHIHEGYDGCI